jgi:hypothetical protein
MPPKTQTQSVSIRRRRRLRRALLLAPVVVMAFSLSGCVWAFVFPLDDGSLYITVKPGVTKMVIDGCSSRHPGDAQGRAICALDSMAALCATQEVNPTYEGEPQPPRVPQFQCDVATDHQNSASMKQAIGGLLANGGACLTSAGYSGHWDWVKRNPPDFPPGVFCS